MYLTFKFIYDLNIDSECFKSVRSMNIALNYYYDLIFISATCNSYVV